MREHIIRNQLCKQKKSENATQLNNASIYLKSEKTYRAATEKKMGN